MVSEALKKQAKKVGVNLTTKLKVKGKGRKYKRIKKSEKTLKTQVKNKLKNKYGKKSGCGCSRYGEVHAMFMPGSQGMNLGFRHKKGVTKF